jgi:hypothetical protein
MATSITFTPFRSQVKRLMMERGIRLPSAPLRWPDSIWWLIRALMVTTSPALAVLGTFTRGFASFAMVFSCSLSQPPQPPMVTLTVADGLRSMPSAILAMAITSWVLARRMRVAAIWLPAAGPKVKVADRRFGVARRQQHDGHRTGAHDRDRHGVAVFGDFRAVMVMPSGEAEQHRR